MSEITSTGWWSQLLRPAEQLHFFIKLNGFLILLQVKTICPHDYYRCQSGKCVSLHWHCSACFCDFPDGVDVDNRIKPLFDQNSIKISLIYNMLITICSFYIKVITFWNHIKPPISMVYGNYFHFYMTWWEIPLVNYLAWKPEIAWKQYSMHFFKGYNIVFMHLHT